jgi:hypothetical protein
MSKSAAMSGNRSVPLRPCLIALAVFVSAAPALAQEFPLLEERGRPADVYHTFSDSAFKSCHSVECEGIRGVWDLIDLMDHRDIPNSLVQLKPLPANYWQIRDQKVRRRLVAHPDRWPTYCKVVVALAHDIDAHGTEGPYLMFHTLEIVARLRSRSFDCTRQVVALLPRTEDFAEEVRLVHSQCVDNWHRPHCDELRLDVPAKSPGSGR